MTFLRRFESFMEHLLETSVSRYLKRPLDQVTLERRLKRTMEANQIDVRRQIYVPYRYQAAVHPADYTVLLRQHPMLDYDLTMYLTRLAQERGFATVKAIEVIISADPKVQRSTIALDSEAGSYSASDMTEAATALTFQPEPERSTQVDTTPERYPINAQYALTVTINGEVHSIPILQTEVTIGRSTKNHVVLPDQLVSRQHARINYSGRRFVFTDLGTRNGSRINGTIIRNSSMPIAINTDSITIGNYTIKLTIAHTDE
jgi:hypothetical protein